MHRGAIVRQQFGDATGVAAKNCPRWIQRRRVAGMDDKPTPRTKVKDGTATLRLASYQKVERRTADERRKEPLRAALGERRTAGQRVLRALFGT